MRGRATDSRTVARVKAAMGLMTIKGVHYVTGIPTVVLSDWKRGRRQAHVPADPTVLAAIKSIVKGSP